MSAASFTSIRFNVKFHVADTATAVASNADVADCYPCLRTLVLPISPAGHDEAFATPIPVPTFAEVCLHFVHRAVLISQTLVPEV